MDPITNVTKAIDKAEQKLGHNLHPMIVTLPLGAFAVSAISDLAGIFTRKRRYDCAARTSMGIGLMSASAAVVTGLKDYSYIPRSRPSHRIETVHGIGNAIVGALFALSYTRRVRRADRGKRPGLISRLSCLGGFALSVYTGWLGGKLVYEYGEAVKPVAREQEQIESRREFATQGANPM